MKVLKVVTLVLLLSITAALSQASTKPKPAPEKTTSEKQFKELKELVKKAEQGDVEAQFALGEKYDSGIGVARDRKEAIKWYRKAAEQGYAKAQFVLGVLYSHGAGVAKDKKEAIKWYRKAAEQGYARAQIALGDTSKMTKWGPKLSKEELAGIAKLSTQKLVEMLKTGETLHAHAALKQLKSEAHGGLDKNFDLLLKIAAETRGNLIIEGLLGPIKPSASLKEKSRVDKLLNFLDSQLKMEKPRVSHERAISNIARTVYLNAAIRPKWRPSKDMWLHPRSPADKRIDLKQLPIPYANDRVMKILTQQLGNSSYRSRREAIIWLGSVGANDLSKSDEIKANLEAQIIKEYSLNTPKKVKERTIEHIRQSLRKLKHEVDSLRSKGKLPPGGAN